MMWNERLKRSALEPGSDMKSISTESISVLGALLLLPALFLCTCGMLFLALDLRSANDLIASVLATWPGRILLSCGRVGGVLLSLLLSVSALCRARIGLDGRAVYLTFWIARTPRLLILAACAVLLVALLLAYAFVENFSIVAR
jgi:hypothetical protein